MTLGDLAEEDSEALLCSSDVELSLSTSIAKALALKAGDGLRQECGREETRRAMAAEGIVRTSGGLLRAKHILHVLIPESAEKLSQDTNQVCGIYSRYLNKA